MVRAQRVQSGGSGSSRAGGSRRRGVTIVLAVVVIAAVIVAAVLWRRAERERDRLAAVRARVVADAWARFERGDAQSALPRFLAARKPPDARVELGICRASLAARLDYWARDACARVQRRRSSTTSRHRYGPGARGVCAGWSIGPIESPSRCLSSRPTTRNVGSRSISLAIPQSMPSRRQQALALHRTHRMPERRWESKTRCLCSESSRVVGGMSSPDTSRFSWTLSCICAKSSPGFTIFDVSSDSHRISIERKPRESQPGRSRPLPVRSNSSPPRMDGYSMPAMWPS